jgi:hypothetical protein
MLRSQAAIRTDRRETSIVGRQRAERMATQIAEMAEESSQLV